MARLLVLWVAEDGQVDVLEHAEHVLHELRRHVAADQLIHVVLCERLALAPRLEKVHHLLLRVGRRQRVADALFGAIDEEDALAVRVVQEVSDRRAVDLACRHLDEAITLHLQADRNALVHPRHTGISLFACCHGCGLTNAYSVVFARRQPRQGSLETLSPTAFWGGRKRFQRELLVNR